MSDILSTLGFDDVDASCQKVAFALLAAELERLRAVSYADPDFAFDADSIGILANVKSPTTRDQIEMLASPRIRRKTHPFIYLLGLPYKGPDPSKSQYEKMKTKTTQLVLRLASMGVEYQNDIYVACRRVWLAQGKKQRWLLETLRPFDRPFSEIHDDILRVAATEDAVAANMVGTLEEWASVIQRTLDEKEKQRRFQPGDVHMLSPDVVCYESLDDDATTMHVVVPGEECNQPASGDETQFDRSLQGQLAHVQPPSTSFDRSNGIVAARGLEISKRQQMLYASPPCMDSRLTDHEIDKSFDYLLSRAEASTDHLVLLLSMILGRSVPRLCAITTATHRRDLPVGEYWTIGNETVALAYRPELPIHSDLNFERDDCGDHIHLPLPPSVGLALRKQLKQHNGRLSVVNCKSVIKALKRGISNRITAARLQQSLQQSCTSKGVDEVIVAWITGTPARHCAALYYSSLQRSDILSAYYDYLELRLPRKESKRWALPDGTVGSNLRVPQSLVSMLFQEQASRIGSARKGADIDQLGHHNEIALYTSQLLALASGTRAVSEPLGTLSDFNIDGGTVRLADKNNRRHGAYRTVAIGELAIAQACEYNKNLQRLIHTFSETRPELGKRAQNALDGKASWLFLVDQKSTRTLRPKLIQRILFARFRAPLNWPRHFLRSWLLDRGYDRGTIRTFMGHADLGAAPQNRFDGTSMFELRSLATDLDEFLKSLSIPVVTSWT
jgi:site-specific recombinase XerD